MREKSAFAVFTDICKKFSFSLLFSFGLDILKVENKWEGYL